MTTIEELQQRVMSLETIVSHLSTHHDEKFLMVEDDVTADTCERLFNGEPSAGAARDEAAGTTPAKASSTPANVIPLFSFCHLTFRVTRVSGA